MTPPNRTTGIDPGAQAAPDVGILAEITAGLASGNDLQDLLQRFLEPVVRLSGAQAGAVRVLSDGGELLELAGALGLPDGVCGSARAVDAQCGHCGAAAEGQPLVWASDLSACSARSDEHYFGSDCRRLLAVPLQHRGRILGVYNLFFAGTDQLPAEVLALLKSVGELLGLALHNARLEAENLRATLLAERQMMAADVHDSLGQSLAFVKMRMPLLRDALRARDEARTQAYLDDIDDTVSQAHASLRGILAQFRAPMDARGLVHALDAGAETFRRISGTELEFVNELPGLQLDQEREAQVFHIVQEALANVARHAAAQHARLRISPAADRQVEIVVEDDGAGLSAAAGAGGTHYGMEIMHERARRLGGGLEVGARAGGGTRVRLLFPAPPVAAAAPAAGARGPR
jgi:two-component system nitrate/nitrite sensor histidine kinase NarX